MFIVLLKKEILANLYNQRYLITLLLLVFLIGGSSWTMQHAMVRRLSQHDEAVQAYREEALASGQIWQFMATGVTLEKPPGPLSMLSRGLESEMTRSLSYSGWSEPEVGPLRVFNPLLRMYATPDFLYIISVIGSLLALLFVYDAICGEKEQGTLRLQLTYPIPRDYILLSKWAGGFISLGVPLLLSSIGMSLYLFFIPGFEFTIDFGVRFLLVLLLSLLYLSAFFTLGLFVSCTTHRSSTALMVCLFLWIVLVLTLPNLMPMVARGLRPIPSEGMIAIEKMHKTKEVSEWAGKTLRAAIHDENEYHDTVERHVAKALEGIDQFRRNQVYQQMTLAMNLSRISPVSCYLFAGNELAQTGPGAFTRFQRYVIWYRQLFNQAKDRIIEAARARTQGDDWWGAQALQAKDLEVIPPFKPLNMPCTDSVRFALFDLLILVTYNIVLFLAAYAAFLRYDAK